MSTHRFAGVHPNKKLAVMEEAYTRQMKLLEEVALDEDRLADEALEQLWEGEMKIRKKRFKKMKQSKQLQGSSAGYIAIYLLR